MHALPLLAQPFDAEPHLVARLQVQRRLLTEAHARRGACADEVARVQRHEAADVAHERGHAELTSGQPERAATLLRDALDLWRGPALADLAYEASVADEAARLEETHAPKTVAVIRKMLPLRSKIVHCRWSGESTWIPMGEKKLALEFENHTSHPAPGMLLLYPGGISETELLFPYGSTMFASKVGQLAGNHFATVTEGQENLPEIGRLTLWEGAQEIVIEEVR